jgi:hypothetical protein
MPREDRCLAGQPDELSAATIKAPERVGGCAMMCVMSERTPHDQNSDTFAGPAPWTFTLRTGSGPTAGEVSFTLRELIAHEAATERDFDMLVDYVQTIEEHWRRFPLRWNQPVPEPPVLKPRRVPGRLPAVPVPRPDVELVWDERERRVVAVEVGLQAADGLTQAVLDVLDLLPRDEASDRARSRVQEALAPIVDGFGPRCGESDPAGQFCGAPVEASGLLCATHLWPREDGQDPFPHRCQAMTKEGRRCRAVRTCGTLCDVHGATDDDLCGMPTKNGGTCRVVVTTDACRVHHTPRGESVGFRRKRQERLDELRVLVRAVMDATCALCGAAPGNPCTTPAGAPRKDAHKQRGPADARLTLTWWEMERLAAGEPVSWDKVLPLPGQYGRYGRRAGAWR